MLPINNEVCTQEEAQKLQHLGVKQQSEFYWRKMLIWDIVAKADIGDSSTAPAGALYSAFTLQEIFELLPVSVQGYTLQITKTDKAWVIQYVKKHFFIFTQTLLTSGFLVDALVYLLENHLIDAKSL